MSEEREWFGRVPWDYAQEPDEAVWTEDGFFYIPGSWLPCEAVGTPEEREEVRELVLTLCLTNLGNATAASGPRWRRSRTGRVWLEFPIYGFESGQGEEEPTLCPMPLGVSAHVLVRKERAEVGGMHFPTRERATQGLQEEEQGG